MPYTLIKGTFRPEVGAPDGDSVRFQADMPALFDKLKGIPPVFGTGRLARTVQLRYEGIDTIEKDALQSIADASLEANLSLLKEHSSSFRGYILSQRTDNTSSRRPIAFLFSGDTSEPDGATIHLEKDLLVESVNYKMVSQGLAYVMFYRTLYAELRLPLQSAFLEACQRGAGIHALDSSLTGVTVNELADLKSINPIFPKLWRRLKDHLSRESGLDNFLTYLERKSDRLTTSSDMRYITFDNAVEVSDNTVKLLYEPYDMIFD
jgi:hypothetical protein